MENLHKEAKRVEQSASGRKARQEAKGTKKTERKRCDVGTALDTQKRRWTKRVNFRSAADK
jgi:hypothetical protein